MIELKNGGFSQVLGVLLNPPSKKSHFAAIITIERVTVNTVSLNSWRYSLAIRKLVDQTAPGFRPTQ